MATLQSAIRDRASVLIAGLTPSALPADKFRAFRNEGNADFVEICEKVPGAALRKFQIRGTGTEDPPEVSDTLTDLRHFTLLIIVAYPHTARYGADRALDRDDVIQQDFAKIEQAIGIYGRANFSSTHDCTPLGNRGETMKNVVRGTACDFLEVTAQFSHFRSVGG